MTTDDRARLLARVGVPWWLWREAEASVALSRDHDGHTQSLDERSPMADDHNGQAIPANERRVRIGGLMRCCLSTINESAHLTRVGDELRCKYAPDDPSHVMVVRGDGSWEWSP